MATEYKVVCETLCFTSQSKAKAIEHHLNHLATQDWQFAALDPITFLGIDIGFYLILQRPESANP